MYDWLKRVLIERIPNAEMNQPATASWNIFENYFYGEEMCE
jgi:hypothetical protein